MKSCYDLTLELIGVMADIDRAMIKARKAMNISEKERIFHEVDRLETRMYEIKNILKSKSAD